MGWNDEDTSDNCVGRNFDKCLWIWGIIFGILGLALLPLFVVAQPIIWIYLLIRWKRIPHIYCTVTVTVGTSSLFYPDQIRSPDWVPGPSTYSELQRLQVERPSRGMFVYCLLDTSWALQHMMYCPDFVSFGHFSWSPTTRRRRRAWCLVTSGRPGGVLAG